MPQEEDRIRTIAGYLLKNNCRLILRASPEIIDFVKTAILHAFNDPAVMIRNAAGQDIVAFLGILEPRNWPECLQQLVNTLDCSNPDQQEVSSLLSFPYPIPFGWILCVWSGQWDVNGVQGCTKLRTSSFFLVSRPFFPFCLEAKSPVGLSTPQSLDFQPYRSRCPLYCLQESRVILLRHWEILPMISLHSRLYGF